MIELEKIIDSGKCYGCAACVNRCKFGALKMEKNEQGFFYPKLETEKCRQCGQCAAVCPAAEENKSRLFGEQETAAVYSVRHKDEAVRRKSSSGGMFTALSDAVLDRGGVICGVVWNEDFSVKHLCTDSREGREAMVQSKYVQSDVGYCYEEIKKNLKDGKTVLFTGTPCQTAALKLYLGSQNTDRLILCDILCGGNVSPGLFQDYVAYIEKLYRDKAVSVCFRTKKYGWKQHHIRVNMKNSVYEGARRDQEPFFSLYLGKYSIRESCFSCGFASVRRVSDITLGDFWGIDRTDAEIDDDLGISFVRANTEKGKALLEAAGKDILMEERDINIAVPKQINLRNAPVMPKDRQKFWNDYAKKGGEYVLKKYTTFGFVKKSRMRASKVLKKIGLK